jgi:hypothetical protein
MRFKNARLGAPLFTVVTLSNVIGSSTPPAPTSTAEMQRTASEIRESFLQDIDPDLLKRAADAGIYNRNDYPVLRSMNPFFIRGDFNGDGAMDLAVWVTQRSSGLRGVAVIHSTLDAVHYLGAGHNEYRHYEKPGEVFADAWHVLPIGSVEQPVNMNVPEIGAVDGRPFTFQRETLQFNWLGRSSYVYYWGNGRYWMIQTGD